MARVPKNKTEAAKADYKNWNDDVKVYKTRKRVKWDYKFVKIAARLIASGHSEKDLGYVLGVRKSTIAKWKQRYPQFKAACSNGKKIAQNYLISNGLKAACGYDYDEETYELRTVEGQAEKQLVCVKKVKKHQKPDAGLLQFFLINMSDSFTNTKNINITEKSKNLNIKITGQIESDMIREFAGKLLAEANEADKRKKVKSKIIEGDSVESDSEASE